MAGTLSNEFKAHFGKANPEPVVQVAMQLTAPSSYSLFFHNGHNGVDPTVEGDPTLASITNVANSLDPVTRKNQISSIQFEVIDDGYVRDLATSRKFYNTYVYISLGAPEMVITDYAPVFFGRVSRVWVERGSILFEATDYEDLVFNQVNFRTYFNKHPLEVLLQSLQDSGVPAARLDSSSFATTSVASTSHLVFSTYTGSIYGDPETYVYDPDFRTSYPNDEIYLSGMHSALAPGTISESAVGFTYTTLLSVLTDKFLKEYLELTRSVLRADVFNSKLKMVKTVKTDAVVKHFTLDEYTDFEVEPNPVIFNRVVVKIGVGNSAFVVRFKDGTSVSSYGEHEYETSTAYFSAASEVIEEDYNVFLSSSFASLPLRSIGINGFTGTRNLHAGSQVTADKIDADNPFYGLFLKGIHKGVSNTTEPDTGLKSFSWAFDEQGASDDLYEGLGKIQLNGLSRISGTAAPTDNEGYLFHDITAVYLFAQEILDRYSNSAPRIKFMAPLDSLDIELGDLISIDNDWFLSAELSLNGLDSSTKFEIVKKEVNLIGDTIGVAYEAVYMTTTSPPSIDISWIPTLDTILKPIRKRIFLKNSYEMASQDVVHNGLKVSATSGLGYSISAGKATAGGSGVSLQATQALTATANKHTYVGLDANSGCIVVSEVATSAAEPALKPNEIRLGKIVAASSVSSVADFRRFGPISTNQLDLEAFEPGVNLLWNPGFEQWPNPGVMCPSWDTVSGAFGTELKREESTVHGGSYALQFIVASGGERNVTSSYVPVEPLKAYRVSAWIRGTNSGDTLEVKVLNFKKDRSSSSTATTSINTSTLGSAGAWIQRTGVITTASDTRFIKLDFYSDDASGTLYMDDCIVSLEKPSFQAITPATSAGGTGNAIAKDGLRDVFFTSDSHNYGGLFDRATGRFTAPEAGIYDISFTCKLLCSGGEASRFIGVLRKNGSDFKEAMGGLSSASGNEAQVTVTTGPVELVKGDYITTHILIGNRDATLQTGANDSYFSAKKIS